MGVPTKVPTVAGSRMRNHQQLVEKNEGLAGFEPATCGLGNRSAPVKQTEPVLAQTVGRTPDGFQLSDANQPQRAQMYAKVVQNLHGERNR